MKIDVVIFSSFLSVASAYDFSQWSPAGPSDVRSPCPMLNALANHDILPHSGKGLTVSKLQDALKGALNIGADLSTPLAIGGLLTSSNPLGLSFNLDDLNQHNAIEHDASLGHADYNLGGDDHTFNQTVFDTYLAYYDGMDKTNITQAAKGRYMRVQTESKRDPMFTYGPKQFLTSYGETALVMSAFNDPVNCQVPVDWLKVLWEQERLPYNEGWRTTDTGIGLVSVNLLILKLIGASGEAVPEGLLVAENTVGRVFAGLDPTGLLSAVEKTLLNMFNISNV